MYTGIGTMRNTTTYRKEQNVNDTWGIRYSLKTGNIFTDDSTFSRRKAEEWIRQGLKVYEVRDFDGHIIKTHNC